LGLLTNIRASQPALSFNVLRALVFFALVLHTHAQFRLDTWTTDNGLPQNSITGLTQTPDEYLWFTTNDGLVRFDGNRFTIYNKSNSPQITTNRLGAAFADKSGRMWFHAEDGGILYYQKGVFTVVSKPGDLPSGPRSRFFEDPSGGVILNIDHRPYWLQNGKFAPLIIENLPADSPYILTDREGGMWFRGSDSIYLFKNDELKTFSLVGFFNGKDYYVAFEDSKGRFWFGSFQTIGGFQSLLRLKDGRFQEVRLPDDPVDNFAEDADGNLWLSIYGRGIYRIDREEVIADELPFDAVKLVLEMDGISTHTSGHLIFDREGGLWVGTEKGLNRISTQLIKIFSRKDGLRADNVYPIFGDKNGSLWAGVWPNNLVKYQNGKFTTRVMDQSVFITSLFEDSRNRFWYGTIGNLYFLENAKPVAFTAQAGFPAETEFSVITQTGDGALWFGTNRGLGRYHDGRASIYRVQDGLPDDYVLALLPAKDGKFWIGTRGGLALFENGSFTSFTVADGLASNSIRSLYEDADGVLWIGSYDGGLTRLKDGKFTVYTMQDGLSSNGVFCILEDPAGWFWINSNQGIYRVSRQELNDFADGKTRSLNSIAYNKKDGLLNVEGNGGRQPAGTKTADGRFWFPTAEGIAVIDPAAVLLNRKPPPVLIEEVLIDRTSVTNDDLQAAIDRRSEIELQPGRNNLEINYTALSFVNSEQLKFKYKLENLEADWNEVGTRRTAYYSYLPPGEYVFRVIAANRDGIWNEQGANIAVIVYPPFYRTWWFMLIVFISVLAIAGLAYYLRVRQLKIRSAQQEEFARQLISSQEHERERIAGEMHDGLGQSLAIIKNRAMISLSKPDDQHHSIEQLREIAEASTGAIDEVHDIIYDLRPIHLDRLGLTGAIEEIAERIAEINDLKLSKDIDDIDNIFPKQSENSVYRIVQETLNNVVKHSKATSVELIVKRSATEVRITVKDNGQGFESGQYKGSHSKGGFGLLGMGERARLLGGQTIIESAKDAGTTVSIVLPASSPKD